MRYEVYLDSYFWMNFFLNCAILYLTGELKQYRLRYFSLCMGSAAGALLSCAGILLPLPGIVRLTVWSFLCAGSSVWCAFRLKYWKALCGVAFFYWAAGCLIGTAVLWCRQLLLYITGRKISLVALFLITAASTAGIGAAVRNAKENRSRVYYKAVLTEANRSICITALLDTGNGLTEPFSQKPVCIVDRKCLLDIAGEDYRKANPRKSKIIPYHSIGKPHGLMEGFAVDSMEIDTGERLIKRSGVIVAISNNEISGGGSYQMILHPSMIKEEEEIT